MWCSVLIASVFILSLFTESANCIECYSCISSENPDCVNPEKYRLEKVKCGLDGLTQTYKFAGRLDPIFSKIFEVQLHENVVPLNCLKQVTSVHGNDVILRGCQLPKEARLDVCNKVFEVQRRDTVEVKHCSLCEYDGCNAASGIIASTFTTCFIAIIAAFR